MPESQEPKDDLSGEFKRLGANVQAALVAAWESPSRHEVQRQIQAGLEEVSSTLRNMAEEAAESETAQHLKAELDDLGERVAKGELEAKVRNDLISALRGLNAELERVVDNWRQEKPEPTGQGPGAKAASSDQPASNESQ